jgi:outer membrane protein OmpA-like peptidoglycan-associated protein
MQELEMDATSDDDLRSDAGSVSGDHPPAELFPVLAAPTTTGKGKNTIRFPLVPEACWKLNNVRFAFGSSFVMPGTRVDFRRLSAVIRTHPGAPLSIFGHADPVSDDSFNKKLSGYRAESIYAVLLHDAARWERLYLAAGPEEGWGVHSIRVMLSALNFDAGPQVADDVRKFQRQAGLREDGDPGPKTRAKLFEAYMAFLFPQKLQKTDFLARGADPNGKGDVQGCGEFNPVMVFSQEETRKFSKPENKSARDAENEINRRVVILFFSPGATYPPNKWPCPRIGEAVDGCRKRFWHDGQARRSPQPLRREFYKSRDTFACRFYHRLTKTSPCEGIDPISYEFAFSV